MDKSLLIKTNFDFDQIYFCNTPAHLQPSLKASRHYFDSSNVTMILMLVHIYAAAADNDDDDGDVDADDNDDGDGDDDNNDDDDDDDELWRRRRGCQGGAAADE